MPQQHNHLCRNRCESRATYSPLEQEYEQRSQHCIDNYGHYRSIHGLAGLSGRPHHCIQPQVQMRKHIAGQNYYKEIACIRQCIIACSEKAQNRVQKYYHQQAETKADDYIHRYYIAENVLGYFIIFFSQLYRHQGASANTYHRAESGRDIHNRQRKGQSHNCARTYALPDKNTVDYVIQRRGYHSHYSRHSVLHKQAKHRFFSKLSQLLVIYHIYKPLIGAKLLKGSGSENRIYCFLCITDRITCR